MRKLYAARTIEAIVNLGLTLPEGIGLLTSEDHLPVFPIFGGHGTVTHWVIYFQKVGTGPRPPLSQAAHISDGVCELGNGWRLMKVRVADSEIGYTPKIIALLKQRIETLNTLEEAPCTAS